MINYDISSCFLYSFFNYCKVKVSYFVGAGIIPNQFRRKKATLSIACREMDPEHLKFPSSTPVHTNYTTARTQIEAPFVPAALELY